MTWLSWPTPNEFYNRYRDDPEEAKRSAYRIGQEVGQMLKERNSIKGDGLEELAQVINAAMSLVHSEPSAKVEGGKVVKSDRGFCVIMRSALSLGIPWRWLDTYYAWPWLEGIASTVRSDVRMKVTSSRSVGDPACTHIFEIARAKT